MDSLFVHDFLAGSGPQAPFEVGQRWRYRHEGPRPGNVEPNVIDGERILWVLSATEGSGDNAIRCRGTIYERREGHRTALRRRGWIAGGHRNRERKRRNCPAAVRSADGLRAAGNGGWGDHNDFTTLRMDSADFALPSKTTIERLADETITTPAGDFAGCPHYRSVTASTVNVKIAKIPMTEERERWHHPTAQGMVKEVYRRGPVKFLAWSRPGYTATRADRIRPAEPEPIRRHAGSEGTEHRRPGSRPARTAGRPGRTMGSFDSARDDPGPRRRRTPIVAPPQPIGSVTEISSPATATGPQKSGFGVAVPSPLMKAGGCDFVILT